MDQLPQLNAAAIAEPVERTPEIEALLAQALAWIKIALEIPPRKGSEP